MKFFKSLLYISICFFFLACLISNSMAYSIEMGKKMSELDNYYIKNDDGSLTNNINYDKLDTLSADELRSLFSTAAEVSSYFEHSLEQDADYYYSRYQPLVSAIQDKIIDMGEHTSDDVPADLSDEELLAYTTIEQVRTYLLNNNVDGLSDEVKDHFNSIIDQNRGSASADNETIRKYVIFCQARMQGLSIQNAEALADDTSFLQSNASAEIFKEPGRTNTVSSESGMDDIISQGDGFEAAGSGTVYDQQNLQSFSKSLYNILLAIGVAVSVIIGMTLGIKFTMAGVDEKADIKKQLFIYIAGCVIVFGAFAIWKLAVDVLAQI